MIIQTIINSFRNKKLENKKILETNRKIWFVLLKLSTDERAHAYVQKNCWEWPEVLIDFKPLNWDKLTIKQKYKHPLGSSVWRILNKVTTRYEQSRQWFREQKLLKSDEEHLKWWLDELE